MQQDVLDISVIIPTRNRVRALRRCLRSLAEQTLDRERFEVVVVCDGLDERGVDSHNEFEKAGLRVRVLRQRRSGPASARNLGAQASPGRVFAFTDDDCIPEPTWLERAVQWFNRNPDWVGLEGAVEPIIFEDSHPHLGERVVNLEGENYATANMLYRREVFFTAGGFDSRFRYPRLEDTELAARVRRYGPIGFCRDVIVRHPVSAYIPWGRALRARYLMCDVQLLRMNPSFFASRGIRRERDLFVGALVAIFRNGREREAIRRHPSLLPQFLISVGLEKVAIAAVFLLSTLNPRAGMQELPVDQRRNPPDFA